MKQELKLPAQCALIPPEEQLLVSGGAPAWMTDFVADVKNTLRPYKPYVKFAWEIAKAGITCIGQLALIYGYTKIIVSSLKGIKSTIQAFPW